MAQLTRRGALVLGTAALAPWTATAGAVAPPPGLQEGLARLVATGTPGVTAIVRSRRGRYRLDVGAIEPRAALPIASATKWLTAALVMTVVDEGRLHLDRPISDTLDLPAGPARAITLRQLLSFTAGQGSLRERRDLDQDRRISLAESARLLASAPLEDAPGAAYRYGGPSMQLAGAMVEQATGRRWGELFDARIARPLGMTATYWSNPDHPTIPPAAVANPLLQGGVFSTAEDYFRFLDMIAANGVFDGHRVLTAKSIATIETAQTVGTPKAFMPPGVPAASEYGLGVWCEATDRTHRGVIVSSPGALGTYPWIHRERGVHGVFFMRHQLRLVAEPLRELRETILAAER